MNKKLLFEHEKAIKEFEKYKLKYNDHNFNKQNKYLKFPMRIFKEEVSIDENPDEIHNSKIKKHAFKK